MSVNREVMERLMKYGLKENLEKKIYQKEEVKIFEYLISYNSIKPNVDRSQG